MHTRERGAVNTMFFLIIFVLMLGAGFFGYTQYDAAKQMEMRAEAAKTEAARLKLDRIVRDHLLEDLRKVVGEAGTYKGRTGWDYSADLDEARKAGVEVSEMPEVANVTVPSAVTTKVDEFARDLKIPASLTTGLADFLGQILVEYKKRGTELADANSQVEKLRGERTALERSVAQINTERAAEASASNKSNTELRQYIDSNIADKQRLIDTMRNENNQRRTEISELTEKHKGELRDLDKVIGLKDAKIAALASTVKLVNPPQAADGSVLSTSSKTGLGYIDLGTKDMLPVGAIFTITDAGDGKEKAKAQVKNVERDRAEVMIFGVKDKFDYPVQGDKISSPLYSPGVRRQVALIGRFGYPYTKDTIKEILESLGNTVHDKVGPGVDLVIIGDETLNAEGTEFVKVEDTDDYKLASTLGAEFAPVNKIRGFLKL
ncbi:MAG: hypothetical protein R3F56_14085 [Planctomycetota bacterium]